MRDLKKESAKTMIYVGPNIGHVLQRFRVFKGGIPTTLTPTLEDKPTLKGLFIEVDQLPQAIQDLRDPNSTISTLCKQITK
jgi:hypothetical protein